MDSKSGMVANLGETAREQLVTNTWIFWRHNNNLIFFQMKEKTKNEEEGLKSVGITGLGSF